MNEDETKSKELLKQQILSERANFIRTYDTSLLPSIISGLREYLTMEVDAGEITMTKLDIAKISNNNFGSLMDYIISGNKGYVRDYQRQLQYGA